MTTTEVEAVFRRVYDRLRATSCGATFIWVTTLAEGMQVRRIVVDAETGRILDEAWLDGRGRVRHAA